MNTHTVAIRLPSYKLDSLKGVVAEFANRAAKLGVEAPSLLIGKETLVDVGGPNHKELVAFTDASVLYTIAAIAGKWHFLASIETLDRVDGQPRNAVNGPHLPKDIAVRYITAEQTCEHCNANRLRNQTYIVRSTETGETKQVGSTCIHEYTGIDPAAALARLQFDAEIAQVGDDEGLGGYGSNAPRFYGAQEVAAVALSIMGDQGFISREHAEIHQTSTTGQTIGTFFAHSSHPSVVEWKASVAPTEAHKAEAKAILAALRERILPDYKANPANLDGFSFKVGIILNRDGLELDQAQLFAAALASEVKRIAEAKVKATIRDEFIPGAKEGDKLTLAVVVQFVKSIETAYGSSLLIKFITTDGYPVTTFYAGKDQYAVGQTATIKGTVKRLEDGRYGKAVVLTRVKATA